MAESMVTRVAKAMFRAQRYDAIWPWEQASPGIRNDLLELARAAIEAMREPPEPDAEVWRCPCCDQFVDRETMAALAETKEESND